MRQTYYQAYQQVLESEKSSYVSHIDDLLKIKRLLKANGVRDFPIGMEFSDTEAVLNGNDVYGHMQYAYDMISRLVKSGWTKLYGGSQTYPIGFRGEDKQYISPDGRIVATLLIRYKNLHSRWSLIFKLNEDELYESVNESNRERISKTVDVKNPQVKPYSVKRTVGSMNKPMNQRVEQEFVPKTPKDRKTEQDPSNHIIRASQNGIPVDSKARNFIRAKDLNAKFRGKVVSPFYKQKEDSKNPLNSGIFSEDENSVCAALSNGVPSNKPVRSKLLSRRSIYDKGLGADDFVEDVGMMDALTWQCWNGNYTNVKQILKHGYDAPKSYSGMNPITASVDGRNIECLKIVLSVPKILDLVNSKDGFGNYPLECTTKIKGIDPYEFAKILVEAGARDDERTGKDYNAAMLSLLNGTWTPNLFGELLPVTDLEHKTKDGLDLRSLAEKLGNREAVLMIDNFKKYGDESINQAVTHSLLISHI